MLTRSVSQDVGVQVGNNLRERRVAGSKVQQGEYVSELRHISKDNFEGVERTVDAVRDNMREEQKARQYRELEMAYMEEGIMMY